jgi:flagellar FliL protein
MAENEELDLAETQSGGGKKKQWILYGIIALLVIGMGVTTTMLLLGRGDQKATGKDGKGEVAAAERPETHYLPLDTMVVNFDDNGPARFLQVDIQLMAHQEDALNEVQKQMPAIRNDILMLLSAQTYKSVSTLAGKEALRKQILQAVNKVLVRAAAAKGGDKKDEDKKDDKAPTVDAVYFTSFVMQ